MHHLVPHIQAYTCISRAIYKKSNSLKFNNSCTSSRENFTIIKVWPTIWSIKYKTLLFTSFDLYILINSVNPIKVEKLCELTLDSVDSLHFDEGPAESPCFEKL